MNFFNSYLTSSSFRFEYPSSLIPHAYGQSLFTKRNHNKGFSLIEVMLVVVIMSLVGLGIVSMISNMIDSQAALDEKLATIDAANGLQRALSDSGICGAQLSQPLPPVNLTAASPSIVYPEIRMGLTNTSPLLVKTGQPLPGYPANKMVVQSITLKNIVLISGDSFSGDLEVDIDRATMRRSLKSFGVKKLIFTVTPPLNAATVASCGTIQTGKGFCTPSGAFDNSNTFVCNVITGFTERKIRGYYASANAENSACCYVPNGPGSPGWCSPNIESYGGAFNGCGASTADYTVVHIRAWSTTNANDTHACCFIPKIQFPGAPGANTFSTSAFMRAESGWTTCGEPLPFYDVIDMNLVFTSVGRSLTCTYVSK